MKALAKEERKRGCRLRGISFLLRNERTLVIKENPFGFSEGEKTLYLRGLRKIKRAAGAWGPERARFYLDLASPSLQKKILLVLGEPTG